LLNAALAIAILHLISQVHLPSFVKMLPKYLKEHTHTHTHTHTHIYMCTHICMYTHTCKHNVTIFSNVQVRGHLLQIKTCIKISAFDTSLNGKQSTDRHEFSVGMMGKVSLLQYVFIKKSSHSNVPHIYVCQMQQYVSTLSLIIYKRSQVKH